MHARAINVQRRRFVAAALLSCPVAEVTPTSAASVVEAVWVLVPRRGRKILSRGGLAVLTPYGPAEFGRLPRAVSQILALALAALRRLNAAAAACARLVRAAGHHPALTAPRGTQSEPRTLPLASGLVQ